MNSTIENFKNYLADKSNWKYNKDYIFFYDPSPEFRIIKNNDANFDPQYNDQWFPEVWKHHQTGLTKTEYLLKYNDLTIAEAYAIWGDNGRIPLPYPKVKHIGEDIYVGKKEDFIHEISKKSFNYLVADILYNDLDKSLINELKQTTINVKE